MSRPIIELRELSKTYRSGSLEVEALRRMGLARGGSLENAVVIEGDAVLNPEGLRRPDEFVRHKILDAVGVGAEVAAFQPQSNVRVMLDPAGHPFCLYTDD